MANQQKNGLIPGWMIVVGFMIGFWPGAILLGVRIAQESGLRGNNGQSSSTRTTYTSTRSTSQSEWARNARDVDYRTADRQDSAADGSPAEGREPRVYHPNQSANGGQNAQKSNTNGNYQYHYNYRYGNSGNSGKARSSGSLLDHPKLSAKRGKGLRLAGAITMGCGAFVAAIVMLGALSEGLFSHDFWVAMLGSLITAMTICTPGAVLNIVGARTNDRVMRCRTYAAMIGDRRSVDIDELAGAGDAPGDVYRRRGPGPHLSRRPQAGGGKARARPRPGGRQRRQALPRGGAHPPAQRRDRGRICLPADGPAGGAHPQDPGVCRGAPGKRGLPPPIPQPLSAQNHQDSGILCPDGAGRSGKRRKHCLGDEGCRGHHG